MRIQIAGVMERDHSPSSRQEWRRCLFYCLGPASWPCRLPYFQSGPANLPLWQVLFIHPYLVFNWLILTGLAAGILMASPRWTYSYLGWAILFGLWWSNMGFYGYSTGWKIWLPFLGVFLVAILIRRSWQPLRACLAGMMDDWTLPSLALYILYGGVYMLYDSNHHPYVLVFIAATTLGISLGAWGYFRAAAPLTRILALLAGLFVATVLSAINEATWDFGAYYGLPESSTKCKPDRVCIFNCPGSLDVGQCLARPPASGAHTLPKK